MLVFGDICWVKEEYKCLFKVNIFFIGGEVICCVVDEGWVDYIFVFLFEILSLFSDGMLVLDVVLVNVSLLDEFGYCFLGVVVDIFMFVVRNC